MLPLRATRGITKREKGGLSLPMVTQIPSQRPYGVHIHLAVRNGARWLERQLLSILHQENATITFSVTDDASHDDSLAIINRLIPPRQLDLTYNDEPVGVPLVFLEMLRDSPSHDYYALADQDDYWHPDKLEIACKALSAVPEGTPALWVSSVILMRENEESGRLHPQKSNIPSLGNALVEGIAPGCSMVWNSAMQEILVIPGPGQCVMHDTWLYLSACATGVILVEPLPTMEFNLHEHNAIGHDVSIRARIRRHLAQTAGEKVSMEVQAQAFVGAYSAHLSQRELNLALAVAQGNRLSRLRSWFKGDLYRRYTWDNMLLGVRLLLVPKANSNFPQIQNNR